jgi:subtilisin-like proprotein convertase family protein
MLRGAFAVLAVVSALAAAPAAGAAVDFQHIGATATEAPGTSNNDGILEPGETFALTERIRNAAAFGINQVHGSLAYTGGGVPPFISLTQTESDYPNLAAGAQGDNLTSYRGQIAAGAECGQGFNMRLDATSDGGNDQVPFKFSTGVAGALVSHDGVDVPLFVADNSTVESDLQVDEAGRVKVAQVRIGNIAHSATGDLRLEIVAPDGTTVLLAAGEGSSGDNFENTTFSDSATQSITGAAAPFTGLYRPEQPLSDLIGTQQQGNWKLRVSDESGADEGTLNAWGLDLRPALCDGSPVASLAANPNPVLPGDTTVLDASGSVDTNGTITKYEFDLDNDGDFEVDNGTLATYDASFGTRGNYPVHVRVTDDDDKTGTATILVHVTQAPIASIVAAPSSPLSQEDVTFDGSGSADPDGPPLTKYEWDLDDDGTFERDTGTTASTTTQYATPGVRTVRLRVTDQDGASAIDTLDLTVQNRTPTASYTKPAPAIVGSPASFNAAASSDLDGSIDKYEWSFDGDDTYEVDAGANPATTHTFGASGDMTVKLRVTDDVGGTAVLAQTVRVTLAPLASFSATPNPVSLHQPVSFDASASTDPDVGGAIAKYEWDLDGNGSYELDSGTDPTVQRAYDAGGTMAVKLRVTDVDGAKATHSVNVVASNTVPFASLTASPNPVAAGASVLLDARGSSDPDGTIVKYDWDLDGNGSFETTSGATPTRTHTYPNAATFNVGVKVTDNDGGTRTASLALVVTGDPSGGDTGSGTGSGGESGGESGSGAGSGSGSGAGSGGEAGTRFAGRLTGSPIQRLRSVLLRGLAVGCESDRRVTCVLRAELRASDARRLGLRSRTGKAISLGSVRIVASRVGRGAARLKLTSAGKRALRRARRVSLVVRGTVTGDGGRVTASRNFLLRR